MGGKLPWSCNDLAMCAKSLWTGMRIKVAFNGCSQQVERLDLPHTHAAHHTLSD